MFQKKIRRIPFLSRMQIKNQIYFVFCLTVVFPVMLLGFFTIRHTAEILYDRAYQQLESDNTRAKSVLFDVTLNFYSISDDIIADSTLKSILQKDYASAAEARAARESYGRLDSGASLKDNSWRGRFGRYANEAFTAWYQARYIDEIAAAGKQVYNIPMYVNAMLGFPYSEGGMAYNSGGPAVRVLDIWKKAAPSIDLLCPDIYTPARDHYTHFCEAYRREDNALFIPESGFVGTAAALNVIRAAAQYEAVGICCFGAESTLDEEGNLREDVKDTAVSFQMVRNIAPLLVKYHGTGNIHPIIQDEFMAEQLIQLPDYRITAHFDVRRRIPDTRETLPRGRGILVQTGETEFYLTGDNVALDFVSRPGPDEEMPRFWMACRQSNQLNFLTVEEGHFEGDKWVVDFRRNGDETNYELYARKGEVVRIRLNPTMGVKGKVN